MTGVLMAYYAWENKRRDKLAVEHKENSEFLDLTDKENLEFRVSYHSDSSRCDRPWLIFHTVPLVGGDAHRIHSPGLKLS